MGAAAKRVLGVLGRDENGWTVLGGPEIQSCAFCGAGPVCDRVEASKTVYWHLSDLCCEQRAQGQFAMLMRWAKSKRAQSRTPFDALDLEATDLEQQATDIHRAWQRKVRALEREG